MNSDTYFDYVELKGGDTLTGLVITSKYVRMCTNIVCMSLHGMVSWYCTCIHIH